MNVIVLSPHTDDGELGAGGTIAKLAKNNSITYVAFSYCRDTNQSDVLKAECKNAINILGIDKGIVLDFEVRNFLKSRQNILDTMVKLNKDLEPQLVLSPSSFDTHQDHQIIYNECIRAFKKTASMWGMEHPLNNLSFRTDIFVELEEKEVEKKIEALKQYKSQSSRSYFQEEYTKSVVTMHGMNINVRYAEVFECIRARM